MPGPGKKPTSLKVIAGTERKDRAPETVINYALLGELPPIPSFLVSKPAQDEWHRLGPILAANGLLTDAGLMAFANLCAIHGKMVQTWSIGEMPVASMIAQYRNLINDFGLTPVSQGKVKPVGADGQQKNKFQNNGRKSA